MSAVSAPVPVHPAAPSLPAGRQFPGHAGFVVVTAEHPDGRVRIVLRKGGHALWGTSASSAVDLVPRSGPRAVSGWLTPAEVVEALVTRRVLADATDLEEAAARANQDRISAAAVTRAVNKGLAANTPVEKPAAPDLFPAVPAPALNAVEKLAALKELATLKDLLSAEEFVALKAEILGGTAPASTAAVELPPADEVTPAVEEVSLTDDEAPATEAPVVEVEAPATEAPVAEIATLAPASAASLEIEGEVIVL